MKELFFALFVAVPILAFSQCLAADKGRVIGVVENVRVDPGGILFNAKMDTGADNSSVNASVVRRFKRRGESWVLFELINAEGDSVTIERKLVRSAKIKGLSKSRKKRPVVLLTLCVAGVAKEVEVNLVDRTGFRNKMIVGRSFLRHGFLVDPSLKHTVEPSCPPAPKND